MIQLINYVTILYFKVKIWGSTMDLNPLFFICVEKSKIAY